MKFATVAIALFVCSVCFAQDCASKSAPAAQSNLTALAQRQTALDDEALFKATGPALFTMNDALKESARTGKPVVCWMGDHIFADPKARAVSRKLGNTTIQATMDTDGQTVDGNGKPLPKFRVKFSDGNYGDDAQVKFIPVKDLNDKSAEKILAFARGGK